MKNKWGLDPDLLACIKMTILEQYGMVSPVEMERIIDTLMEHNEKMRFISAGLSESDWQEDPD